MKNAYTILWFDDDKRSQQHFQRRLAAQLQELGFGLEVEYHKTVDAAMVEYLCLQMNVYNKFDLIMFDHKLEGGLKGAHLASVFRQKKIFTDMVYYSSSELNTLWLALKKEHVDGVYILNRDGMDTDLIRIVKAQVARVFDVNNMRGYVLQYMSALEGRLRTSLAEDVKTSADSEMQEKADKIVETIKKLELDFAKGKKDGAERLNVARCKKAILKGDVIFDAIRRAFEKVYPQHAVLFGENSNLHALQRTRNVFAHRQHYISETDHKLYFDRDTAHQEGYSSEDFKDLRVQLMKLAEELDPIIGKFR